MDSVWLGLVILVAGGIVGWFAAQIWRAPGRDEPEFTSSLPDARELDEDYLRGELTRAQYEAEQHRGEPPP